MSLLQKIKQRFSTENACDVLYHELRSKSESLISSDPEKAISLLRTAASLAWLSNTSHKHDKKLDAVLHEIGSSQLTLDSKSDPDGEIVIVTSGILEFGGLTQQVVNLVKFFPEDQRLSIWSTESFSNSKVDCERGIEMSKRAPIMVLEKEGDHITRALKVVEWSKSRSIKAFIYFLSPDDTTAFLLPSMLPEQKHVLINVSHHVFCLGSFQFDAIVDVSDFYYNESVRESRNDNIQKIYLSGRGQLAELHKIPKNDVRERMGISDDAYLTVTVGNPNKSIWDADQSYIHIIGRMLMGAKNVEHLLIAKGMDKIKDLIVWHYPKVKNRIHVINGTNELIATLKCCDLYLNSYPQGGALSSLDAIASSLAIVAIPAQREWFKISEITALSQDEYLDIIRMFIQDFEFRLEHAATLQDFYLNNHEPKKVAELYLKLINELQLGTKEYKSQDDFVLEGLQKHVDKGKLEREVITPYISFSEHREKLVKNLRKQLN